MWTGVNPNITSLCRGITHKSAFRGKGSARKLEEDESYLTAREILFEAGTAADHVVCCERSGFGRFGPATLS